MKWTVLGATGVVGQRLVAHLLANGHSVDTPGRDDAGIYQRPLGHVIYCIGLTSDFRQRPHDTVRAHVGVLADVLQRADFESLLYLSSTRVYAHAAAGREDEPLPVLAHDPSDLYNLSKLLGESLCLSDNRRRVRVVRLSNVVGGNDADSGNFVPSLVRAAKAGRIELQTDLDSAKDYVHIDDVVGLLLQITARGQQRIYNVASGVQIAHREWVRLLVERTGCELVVAPHAPLQRFAPIDITRIGCEFAFVPKAVLPAFAHLLAHSIRPPGP